MKHPKILPRGSHVTKLIIKLPGLVIKPDVPEDRLESAPPFYLLCSWLFWSTHHEGKTWGEIKRYVVIFMSMASRAIHLEIANSLDADSFLNSFRRFTIRRRPVRQLQSDQGANFARGWRELMETLNEMDHEEIKPSPLKEQCDWIIFKIMWHGRLVAVPDTDGTENALILFTKQRWATWWWINRDVMCEAEAIVNSRLWPSISSLIQIHQNQLPQVTF